MVWEVSPQRRKDRSANSLLERAKRTVERTLSSQVHSAACARGHAGCSGLPRLRFTACPQRIPRPGGAATRDAGRSRGVFERKVMDTLRRLGYQKVQPRHIHKDLRIALYINRALWTGLGVLCLGGILLIGWALVCLLFALEGYPLRP